MATIKDVAQLANVSVATVSRVVNGSNKVGKKTLEKVKSAMLELSYRPNANARDLVTKRSSTLGVVVPDVSDPFFACLASGVDTIAKKHQLQLLLSTGGQDADSERKAIELLLARRCEVMVVHSKKISDNELMALSKQAAGLIIINRLIPGLEHKCIWLDNYAGGQLAAQHLISKGAVSIAIANSNLDINDPIERKRGFNDYLASLDTNVYSKEINHTPNQQGGELAASALLNEKQSFDAVFAYNDAMAMGIIATLIDKGIKIPEDISVIGFDDVILARYSQPKLTTLSYPIEDMAMYAAELAISQNVNKGDRKEIQSHCYLPKLIERFSS
ncbi:LacI family DNA-binding transcriptional regulator [Parashewanella spongiae]|uniref:LacI family DNA-binding transcriptional regulator n=1 Tax=Parashewanella spongiae TaxID=342950 RepID=A0A3A6UBW6_9GAMM|nr:LacI family DNA-binding transcriptional regulator [Parashewanella spongiae]MCL1076764.1 LacI family DNA-binding transcriptional regulator [Parashewanella spongiae]RJY19503.1 LacI family DNA-binding transcriptional regulator [Parashewanella spongiae]